MKGLLRVLGRFQVLYASEQGRRGGDGVSSPGGVPGCRSASVCVYDWVGGWNQQAEKPVIWVDSFQENSTKIWHLIPGGMTSRREE